MRRVHVQQRANAWNRFNMRQDAAAKAELHRQQFIRRDGKGRKLSILRCNCGRQHWGRRGVFMTEKQQEVNKLCNACFSEKYGKSRPENVSKFVYRELNNKEKEALKRYYEATGVTITNL